ncbi:MAG: hypothetical protein RBS99_13330 [Rhodospirillales bacterium]|jgi:uncharacterized membrane protein|nr:hypothetical protein [Rhodospirillales bacterium]
MSDMNKAAGGDAKQNAEDGKICAIIAYLFPLIGIIWYFVDEKQKNNPFTKYHVKQALVALIVGIVVSVVSCGFLSIVPLIFAILGIINAANGEMKELPVIGKYGEEWFKF